jgi:hypothetical protein
MSPDSYKFSNVKLWVSVEKPLEIVGNGGHNLVDILYNCEMSLCLELQSILIKMCDAHNVRKYNIVKALKYSCQHVWVTK